MGYGSPIIGLRTSSPSQPPCYFCLLTASCSSICCWRSFTRPCPLQFPSLNHFSHICLTFLSSDIKLSRFPACSHRSRNCLSCPPSSVTSTVLTAVWDRDSSMLIWEIHLSRCSTWQWLLTKYLTTYLKNYVDNIIYLHKYTVCFLA